MKGLTYYQADTDRFEDIRIRKLMKKYGLEGYGIYEFVLNMVFRAGYYVMWDEDTIFEVSEKTYAEETQIENIMDYCASIGLFDEDMYYNDHVVTSKSIQMRYREINTRFRRKSEINEYNLTDAEEGLTKDEMQQNDVDETKNVAEEGLTKPKMQHLDVDETENATFSSSSSRGKNKKDILITYLHTKGEDDVENSTNDEWVDNNPETQINHWHEELISETNWLDTVSQEFYPTAQPDRVEKLKAQLEAFRVKLIGDRSPTRYPQQHDYIKHFKSWMRLQQRLESENRNKEKQKQINNQNNANNAKQNTRHDERRGTDAIATSAKQYATTF